LKNSFRRKFQVYTLTQSSVVDEIYHFELKLSNRIKQKIISHLCIYIALHGVHTNQKRYQRERLKEKEKRTVWREWN